MKKLLMIPILMTAIGLSLPVAADRGDRDHSARHNYEYRNQSRNDGRFYNGRHYEKRVYRGRVPGKRFYYGPRGRPHVNNYYYYDDDDYIKWIGGAILFNELLYHMHDNR